MKMLFIDKHAPTFKDSVVSQEPNSLNAATYTTRAMWKKIPILTTIARDTRYGKNIEFNTSFKSAFCNNYNVCINPHFRPKKY
jgi:hypothetical protein